MKRLTTDNPRDNIHICWNLFTLENGQTMFLTKSDEEQVNLCDLMRTISKKLGCQITYDGAEDTDYNISEYLSESMDNEIYSIETLLAYFYTTAWAFADLRERLKQYEDTGLTPEEIINMWGRLANLERMKKDYKLPNIHEEAFHILTYPGKTPEIENSSGEMETPSQFISNCISRDCIKCLEETHKEEIFFDNIKNFRDGTKIALIYINPFRQPQDFEMTPENIKKYMTTKRSEATISINEDGNIMISDEEYGESFLCNALDPDSFNVNGLLFDVEILEDVSGEQVVLDEWEDIDMADAKKWGRIKNIKYDIL